MIESKRSESVMNLAAALAIAQGLIKTATKDNEADTGKFKYKYASLDAIWDVARKPLADNGLSIVQIPTNNDEGFRLETMLLHSSGEWISGTMTLPINAGRMSELQAMGSAITYARRYMLGAMVGVTTGDDDDGRAAVLQQTEYKEPKPLKPTMNVGKLLKRLNQEPEINGFYKKTSDIKATLTVGRSWPEPDDIEAWKLLFTDARDYALDEIERAVEEGDISPDQIPMTQETAIQSASDAAGELEDQYPEIFEEREPEE